RVSVEMCWKPGANYDLTVCDNDTGAEVATSPAGANGPRCSAVVRFDPESGHTYGLRVHLAAGRRGPFNCYALSSGLAGSTAPGSVCFPADGAEVIAVGAADLQGRRLGYSACGVEKVVEKPDLMAPVPFPSTWRARAFGGTSAAAPQAAALAALWWSRSPDW